MANEKIIVEPEGGATGEHSMFIGRFSPPHEGHFKLMQTVLDEGGKIFIAIRDTPLSDKDPYTFEQRAEKFLEHFKDYLEGDTIAIGLIPNIKEVCYGRRVGWAVRQINLDEKTEAISATKIRKGNG